MSLSLIKIWSHLFGKPVLVCRTFEKASTLVQLRIRFKVQRKKKEKKIHERKHPKHVFLKINYAEIILQKWFNEIYLFGLKLINTSERVAYFTKIAGKRTDSCNNKQIKGSSRWNTNSKTFVRGEKQAKPSPIFRPTLRLFRAGKQRNQNKATHLETGFPKVWQKICFLFIWKIAFVVMTNISF